MGRLTKFTAFMGVSIFTSHIYALPAMDFEAISAASMSKQALKDRSIGFDAATQLIDVTGSHAFVPPGPGDLRGPCPGLNSLANHNYLPHNGFATPEQFITATNEVFGMGLDIGTVLAVYGLVMDGNPLSLNPGFSIGGAPSASGSQNLLDNLLGLLGTPQGLTGSHNKYEADASPTRGDLFQYGDSHSVQISQFQTMFDLQPDAATANYDMDVLAQLRQITFERSISQNPYFYYGPFTGMAVSSAAHSFIYRYMANHTAEQPEGVLCQDVLKSFFAIEGESGAFTYKEGWEQIPENWYKRAIGDEYGIVGLELDTVFFARQFPNTLTIGGNMGQVNTFTPLNLSNLSNGVYSADTLLQGNNLACFVFQVATLAAPDILRGSFSNISGPLSLLTDEVTSLIGELGCPELNDWDESALEVFPGYGFSL